MMKKYNAALHTISILYSIIICLSAVEVTQIAEIGYVLLDNQLFSYNIKLVLQISKLFTLKGGIIQEENS